VIPRQVVHEIGRNGVSNDVLREGVGDIGDAGILPFLLGFGLKEGSQDEREHVVFQTLAFEGDTRLDRGPRGLVDLASQGIEALAVLVMRHEQPQLILDRMPERHVAEVVQ
jgi:hypothetical protein